MFVDTSGLLCFFDRRESRHQEAHDLISNASILISHSYVLAEFVPLTHARQLNRLATLEFARDLLDNQLIELIWVNESLHRAAQGLLEKRLDKTYSLCDAVSFVLMRDFGFTEALTTDRHFEQEGFVRLLAP